MLKIFKYLKAKEWTLIVGSIVFIVGQVYLDLKLPDYMAKITTLVQTEGSKTSEIWTTGGKMLLCALGSMILAVIVGYFAARVATSLSKELRKAFLIKRYLFYGGD